MTIQTRPVKYNASTLLRCAIDNMGRQQAIPILCLSITNFVQENCLQIKKSLHRDNGFKVKPSTFYRPNLDERV